MNIYNRRNQQNFTLKFCWFFNDDGCDIRQTVVVCCYDGYDFAVELVSWFAAFDLYIADVDELAVVGQVVIELPAVGLAVLEWLVDSH